MTVKSACTRQAMESGPNKPGSPGGVANSSNEARALEPVMARTRSPMASKAMALKACANGELVGLSIDSSPVGRRRVLAGLGLRCDNRLSW